MGSHPPKSSLVEVDERGAFKRSASSWRHRVTSEGPFKPELGRYHLYVSLACPWANRCLAFRKLKGLEHALEVHVVHPTWKRTKPEEEGPDGHSGWVFADPSKVFYDDYERTFNTDGCTLDTLNGCETVRALYDLACSREDEKDGIRSVKKFTVPILWDSKSGRIVNNESSDICYMMDDVQGLGALSKQPRIARLYPPELAAEMAELEQFIYHKINNGVYKCGLSTTQEAYEEASTALYAALDRVNERLATSRYLMGDELTGIDVWLLMTLVRFDCVYVSYFKCTRKCIREYEHIWPYVRDVWQSYPEIAETIDFGHIRTHYFTSHTKLNPFAIIAAMPDMDLDAPHGRESMKGA